MKKNDIERYADNIKEKQLQSAMAGNDNNDTKQ